MPAGSVAELHPSPSQPHGHRPQHRRPPERSAWGGLQAHSDDTARGLCVSPCGLQDSSPKLGPCPGPSMTPLLAPLQAGPLSWAHSSAPADPWHTRVPTRPAPRLSPLGKGPGRPSKRSPSWPLSAVCPLWFPGVLGPLSGQRPRTSHLPPTPRPRMPTAERVCPHDSPEWLLNVNSSGLYVVVLLQADGCKSHHEKTVEQREK